MFRVLRVETRILEVERSNRTEPDARQVETETKPQKFFSLFSFQQIYFLSFSIKKSAPGWSIVVTLMFLFSCQLKLWQNNSLRLMWRNNFYSILNESIKCAVWNFWWCLKAGGSGCDLCLPDDSLHVVAQFEIKFYLTERCLLLPCVSH